MNILLLYMSFYEHCQQYFALGSKFKIDYKLEYVRQELLTFLSDIDSDGSC